MERNVSDDWNQREEKEGKERKWEEREGKGREAKQIKTRK